MARIINKTANAPKEEAITISQLPPIPKFRIANAVAAFPVANITAATPKLAPAVMPSTDG